MKNSSCFLLVVTLISSFGLGGFQSAVAQQAPQSSQVPDEAQMQGGILLGDAFNVDLFAEFQHTDNAEKTENNEESDLQRTLGMSLLYVKMGKNLDLNVDYKFTQVDYREDFFSDENRLEGVGTFRVFTDNQRLSWLVQHQQDFNQVDTTSTDTPGNRDERTTFVTGPDVVLSLSAIDSLMLSGRHVETSFDDVDDNDSEREILSARLFHMLSESSTVGLETSYSEVEFDRSMNDYERQSIGLTYSSNFRRSGFTIAAGDSSIKRDVSDDVNGYYTNASLYFNTDQDRVNFYFNREITDSSIGLSLSDSSDLDSFQTVTFGGPDTFESGDTSFTDADVVTRTRTQISYMRILQLNKSSVTVNLSQDEEDFDTMLQDQERMGFSVQFNYRLSENLSSDLRYDYHEIDFGDEQALGEDEVSRIHLNFSQLLGLQLTLNYGIGFEWRDNSDDSTREYDATIATIGLHYQLR